MAIAVNTVDTILDLIDAYRSRNLTPKFLYLGRKDWLTLKDEVRGWSAPTLRANVPDSFYGLEVVRVSRDNWIAIGVGL